MMKDLVGRGIKVLKKRGPRGLGAAVLRFMANKLEPPLISQVNLEGLEFFDVGRNELSRHLRILQSWRDAPNKEVRSINWVLPNFINPYGGGHYTIFRFVNMFSLQGINSRLIFYDTSSDDEAKRIRKVLRYLFPQLEVEVLVRPVGNILPLGKWIPYADVTFATTWQSAYYVVRFNDTRAKYYFIQDYEPLFYPAGTLFALAENTYKWNMPAITFGKWLSEVYQKNYGGEAQDFIPCVDRELFKPLLSSPRQKAKRVFFLR
jgi:hypothetical protein